MDESVTPEGTVRFFRSAAHPEFMEAEIAPVLARRGMPAEYAGSVAKLMDCSGMTVEETVMQVAAAVEAFRLEAPRG